jgi:hypothetical protein
MRRNVAVWLWAGLVLGCGGAASPAAEVSGVPDAGVSRSGRSKADAGLPDEPARPLPLSGCGEGVPDCPGGGGGTAPSEPASPLTPTDSPQGPGPDPSPID